MKKILIGMSLVLTLLLSGCLGDEMNSVRTTYPDGRVVVEEFSNDTAYYTQATKAKPDVAEALRACIECTSGELIGLAAVMTLGQKPYVPRGMNMKELAGKVSGDLVSVTPVIGLAVAAYKLASRPNSVVVGENGIYAPFESHLTASDGNSVVIPYRYGTSEDIVPAVSPVTP